MRFWPVSLALMLAIPLGSAFAQHDPDEPPPVTRSPAPTPAPSATPSPSPTPVPTEADVTEQVPPEKAPPSPAEASVSWTALGAQAPQGTSVISVAFGLSGLPQASFHYAIADNLSLGVAGGFDFARYVPRGGFNAAASVAASLKGSYFLDETLHLGWRADVGFLIPEVPDFAIIIDLSANLLAPVNRQLFVGAGLHIPITIGIGNGAAFVWPILVGGVAEFRVLPPLSLFAEAMLGPAFNSADGVFVGARLMGGIAYRL